jgi:transposase
MRRCWSGRCRRGRFWGLLADHGDRIVRDEDFAECYSSRMGRPSIPPSQLAKVLLLQHRTGVSDEQAMQSVAWDLRWKVALGVAVDHEGWHPTSLTKFRVRLLLHGKEGLALENTLGLAEEIGLLEGTAEQIIDSTPMLGAAAARDTVRLVRHGVRKLLARSRPSMRMLLTALMTAWSSTLSARVRSRTVGGARRPSVSGC